MGMEAFVAFISQSFLLPGHNDCLGRGSCRSRWICPITMDSVLISLIIFVFNSFGSFCYQPAEFMSHYFAAPVNDVRLCGCSSALDIISMFCCHVDIITAHRVLLLYRDLARVSFHGRRALIF